MNTLTNDLRCKMLLTVALTGCFASACSGPKPAEPASQIAPTFTIREIMQSMVGPRADSLWNAVGTSVTEKGVEIKAPTNDEEWASLRHEAVTLAEAMNSILIPGRKVANPGDQPKDPQAELAPEQIEILINQDRATWAKLAHDLQDAVTVAIRAVDAKDAEAFSNAGGGIDTACETCHKKILVSKPGSEDKAMKSRSLLLEDHRQILRVLNVLEEMAARAQRGQEPNDIDVKGVVEFMKGFGDSRHQGKEESVLFPALLQGQGQKNYRELCHLIFEHNQERTFIRRLADSMMTGKKKDFVYFASHLVTILRSHLKEEDDVLLPLMKETFSAADDERVARDMTTYDCQWQEEDLAGVLLSLDNLESKYCRKLLMAG